MSEFLQVGFILKPEGDRCNEQGPLQKAGYFSVVGEGWNYLNVRPGPRAPLERRAKRGVRWEASPGLLKKIILRYALTCHSAVGLLRAAFAGVNEQAALYEKVRTFQRQC